MRYIVSILLFLACSHLQAQEILAKLSVNTQKVGLVDQQMIAGLESSINTLLNEQKWTEANFETNERIDCMVGIAIVEMPTVNSFKAEIQITARRPVYNSTYATPLLNFKDEQLDFTYTTGQSLDYSNYNLNNNLVATIAYYAYIIIGLDFDSYSLNGGRPYFAKAMEIANAAQSLGAGGWKPFSGKVNRYDLAVALTDETSKDFHTMWYNYHRQGLDLMETNVSRGRLRIMESIADLEKFYSSRPSSPLFTLFAETKIDELVKVCAEATKDEKKEIKGKLVKMFPSKSSIINTLN